MFTKVRAALVSLGVAITFCGLALTATAAVASSDADNGHPDKVVVCKYVGTPGSDERLQTGQNPIVVSINSIPDYQGVGSYFADAHGRSFVLAVDDGTTHVISECPGYVGQTDPTSQPPTDPASSDPPTDPVTTEPVTSEPPTAPVTTDPVSSETSELPTDPVTTDPVSSDPPTDPTTTEATSISVTDTAVIPSESQVISSRPAAQRLSNTGARTGLLIGLGVLAILAGIAITLGASRKVGNHE
jgi:hypothetical protein